MKKVTVIGGGYAGLSAACYLAKDGFEVTLIEKNESVGGRSSFYRENGFSFDMGPSWYWMPDVFEAFFKDFDKEVKDYYNLLRLDPAYKIYFGKEDEIQIPANYNDLVKLFESIEEGAGKQLELFIKDAEYKYQRSMSDLVQKPAISLSEFVSISILKDLVSLDLFSSLEKSIDSMFKHDKLRKILKFPAYFLGATPDNIPALYSLMNYADLVLGTWYPLGGMYESIKAFQKLAIDLGVSIKCDTEAQEFDITDNGFIKSIKTPSEKIQSDYVIASADYHYIEQNLLPKRFRKYKASYWNKRVMAPSALIVFLGVNKKIKKLKHHNLFFDKDFKAFGDDIYKNPKWPKDPLFYVCVPSKTDKSVAPSGFENLFLLMPCAVDLEENQILFEKYLKNMLFRITDYTGEEIEEKNIVHKKFFAHKEFKNRYHAYKGNAYGLANTLMQTAVLKPKMINPKVKNMAYAGQLTVPGPGVPPSIISGKIAASICTKFLNLETQ